MSEHVGSQQPGPSNEALMKTGWNKCLLRQEVTSEILRCPAESKCLDVGAGKGYFTLSLDITRFSELNELPMPIDLRQLDEGNGVEATLRKNTAKWHNFCHSKFNITKLKRAEKRKSSTSTEGSDLDTTPTKYTCKSSFLVADKTDICFFCETMSSSELLHEVSTFHLDSRVQKCALVLIAQEAK